MKNLLLLLVIVCALLRLGAQPCPVSLSSAGLTGKNVRALILNGGDIFTDFERGQFFPNPAGTVKDPSTFFAAGLWIGGMDSGGNLKIAAPSYRSTGQNEFWAGPLGVNGETNGPVCTLWDKHFLVKRSEIEAFKVQLPGFINNPAVAIAQYPTIMGWPGKGNPYFYKVWGFDLPANGQEMAPYTDKNNDGIYNPLKGDLPAVYLRGKAPFVPFEMVWSVFNDQGGGQKHGATGSPAIHLEVQLTAWTLDCSKTSAAINGTIFTSHKIINRGVELLDSTFIGIWADLDLGCPNDDYVGSRPDLNCFFGYNQDLTDGYPDNFCAHNVATFPDQPPVQTVTFLNTSMDRFIAYSSTADEVFPLGAGHPTNGLEHYRYLTGHFQDGTPITVGGTGYNAGIGTPTNFAFPGDPSDSNQWSMCSANLPRADRRVVAAHHLGKLLPGQIEELTLAWTAHQNAPFSTPCQLGNMEQEVKNIQAAYAASFADPCKTTPTNSPEQPLIRLLPNPASDVVRMEMADADIREVRLFSPDGRLLKTIQNIDQPSFTLDLAGLIPGIYTVQVLTKEGVCSGKLCVARP